MGIKSPEESSFMTTIPQDAFFMGKSRDGRIQRVERQLVPASTTITATTTVTETVQETDFVDDDFLGPNIRLLTGVDAASPVPTANNGLPSPSSPLEPGTMSSNATATGLGQSSNGKPDSWTTKILIAAGAIGLTLVIALAIFFFWRIRNKKKNAAGFVKKKKKQPSNPEPKALHQPYNRRSSLGRPWSAGPLNPPAVSREKDRWDLNSSAGSLLYKPTPAFSRAGLSSSPSLLGMQPQPSRSPFPPPNPMPISSSPLAERSVLYIDPQDGHLPYHSPMTHPRRASIASSSPILPIEGPGLASNVPSISPSDERSQKRRSSTPSIIEFSESMIPGAALLKPHGEGEPRKSSRFSWTNSLAPKTPMDPASRFSIATSTSSVARYRTVDSWVGNQTNRLDEGKFQEFLEREIETKISLKSSASEDEHHRQRETRDERTNDVLNEIHDFMNANEENNINNNNNNNNKSSPETGSERRNRYESGDYARKQRRSGRKNQLNVPQSRDSSAFMVHPGTKIRTPRVSLIPSEILDSKVGPGAL